MGPLGPMSASPSPKDPIRSELRGPQRTPRCAWAARWQVGREQCFSRNATKRHDLTIFASHFRDRLDLLKKVPLGVRLKSTRQRRPRIFYHTSARGPEIKNLDRGCGSVELTTAQPSLAKPGSGDADARYLPISASSINRKQSKRAPGT